MVNLSPLTSDVPQRRRVKAGLSSDPWIRDVQARDLSPVSCGALDVLLKRNSLRYIQLPQSRSTNPRLARSRR